MKMKLAHGIPLLALAAAVQNANAVVTVGPDFAYTPVNSSITIDESQLLANDSTDAEEGSVFVGSVSQESANGGTISYFGYGGVVYTPPENFKGIDTFTYEAFDSNEDSATGVVTVYVGVSSNELSNQQKTDDMLRDLCQIIDDDGSVGSAEFEQSLTDLCALPVDEYNRVVGQITPEEILVMRRMMSNASQATAQRVFQHQTSLRGGGPGGLAYDGQNLMLRNYRGGTAGDEASRWGVFGSMHMGEAEHDQTEYESEYDRDSHGVTVGMDYRFSPGLFAGVAVDWSAFEVAYAADAGKVESDVYSMTGFVTWFHQAYSVDVQLGYATGDYDTRRNMTFPTTEVAEGDTSTNQYNLSVQGDWTWSRDALTLRPYVRVDYMTTEIDAYTESGSTWAMRIGSQDVDQITSSAGVESTYAISMDWGVFVPSLKISAVSESSSDYSPVTFQLKGIETSDGVFALQPDSEDSLFYQYDLNAVFVLKGGWSAFMSGQFISGYDDYSAYVISGGVRSEF